MHIPDHPFYTGLTLKQLSDTTWRVQYKGVELLIERRDSTFYHVPVFQRQECQATTDGGVIDEVLMWLKLNVGELIQSEAKASQTHQLMEQLPDRTALDLMKSLKEVSPGILSDLKKALSTWNLKTKQWNEN